MELFHGNCLDIMTKIQDESIDMVLCDLPYGVTDCEWDVVIDFGALWKEYRRIVKPTGAVVLFCTQPFTTKLISSNMKDFRYCWYWKKNNKTGAPFAKVQPMRCIEDIAVFYRKGTTYNPQGIKLLEKPRHHEPRNNGVYAQQKNGSIQTHTGYPANLIEFPGVNSRDRVHPTQKPVELLEYLINTYTNSGDTVLDNCMGSGSVGIACRKTGRHFIGIELSEKYYKIARQRCAA